MTVFHIFEAIINHHWWFMILFLNNQLNF